MLAEQVGYVVGVDTHRDQHALAVVDAHTGAVIAQTTTTANARGYANAIDFADQYARADRLWAIEGSGHYGAGLARHLQRQGEQVHEVDRSSRGERRLHGKDDQLDAVRAARSPLARERRARPRSGEHQEALRLLLLARRTAVESRKVALVQLRSVIVTAPDGLREELRRLPVGKLLNRCSRFRRSSSRTPDQLATILVLRTLARRVQAATVEAETLEREILGHVRMLAPNSSTGPASARSSPRNSSSPGHTRTACAPKPRSRDSQASPRSRHRAAHQPPPPQQRRRPPTQPRPPHRRPPPTPARPGHHATTSHAASAKARPPATQSACSSATSPATSTA